MISLVGWFLAGFWALYLVGAFYYDMTLGMPAGVTSLFFIVGMIAIVMLLRGRKRIWTFVAICTLITAFWSTIKPSNDRDWVADKAVLAYAEFDGDLVTIHNVRDASYPELGVSEPQYIDRTIDLSKVRGLDLMNSYWSNDYVAHPMFSWRFEDGKSFTISVENRNVKGQAYSVLGGLYKQFEVIYVVSTDRDAILRRTTYNSNDDHIYMYMLDVTAVEARELLVEMLNKVNELYREPAWYNSILNNCTTTIHAHLTATQDFPMPWNWGILFPGLYCKSIYNHGGMVSDLPYEELWKRGQLNQAADRIGRTDDFWMQIRKDVPGFEDYFEDPPKEADVHD